MDGFAKYLLGRLDSLTAWIGVIGFILFVIGWKSGLFILFIALVFLPEAHFRDVFSSWTLKLRGWHK